MKGRLKETRDDGILVEDEQGRVWFFALDQKQLEALRRHLYDAEMAALKEAGVEVTELTAIEYESVLKEQT